MSRSSSITGDELIVALNKGGFLVIRIRGRHHFLRHSDGRAAVEPAHPTETIGPGLLHKILRDCHLSVDDLHQLLRTQ
jgi:predicted RNA binding protein YcfA (HicA-like mRNA interferase family)